MELEQLLAEIDELKCQADNFKPLNSEQNQRLMQKIRLDWNYHSNHIEGNQLSYGETKNLLLWGITARGKPLKDHLEIQGHDEAIDWLYEQLRNPQQGGITQHFIRELHQLILKQNYQMPAITPTGEKITRIIQAGQYKTTPNHVETVTGKIFYFATPEETPAKMTDLVDWFRDQFEKRENHALLVAADFHYKFVRIHPFDDGNGRMARLLMNFILMMYDFPPIIVPTEERETYLQTLALSDEQEDIQEFVKYLGKRLLSSLELYIKAAKGESIEEPDDLDRAINLLKRKFPPKVAKTPERVKQIIFDYIIPFFNQVITSLEKFDVFFIKKGKSVISDWGRRASIKDKIFNTLIFYNNNPLIGGITLNDILESNLSSFALDYEWQKFCYEEIKFNLNIVIKIQFNDFSYIIDTDAIEPRKPLKLYYDSIFTKEEMEEMATDIAKFVLAEIEKQINSTRM